MRDAPRPRHRTTDIAILVVVLALIALSAPLHGRIAAWVQAVQPTLMQHPVGGPALFVVLAALSAMLMFFSSLVLIPIGVVAWGQLTCFMLLWGGWFLGGVLTYSIGRFLGRPVVERMVSPKKIAQYEAAHGVPQAATGTAIQKLVVAKAAAIKVTVNPQYGKWDAATGDVVASDAASPAVSAVPSASATP